MLLVARAMHSQTYRAIVVIKLLYIPTGLKVLKNAVHVHRHCMSQLMFLLSELSAGCHPHHSVLAVYDLFVCHCGRFVCGLLCDGFR
jgi:hypothetical protein